MLRWQIPLGILLLIGLPGCSGNTRQADSGGMPLPTVKMALVRIPLDQDDNINLEDEPLKRFVPEPVAVAYKPRW